MSRLSVREHQRCSLCDGTGAILVAGEMPVRQLIRPHGNDRRREEGQGRILNGARAADPVGRKITEQTGQKECRCRYRYKANQTPGRSRQPRRPELTRPANGVPRGIKVDHHHGRQCQQTKTDC
jgi:hypothetical protein